MNKFKKTSILVMVLIIVASFVAFASLKKEPIWGEMTITTSPDGKTVVTESTSNSSKKVVSEYKVHESKVVPSKSAKENFVNYVAEAISVGYTLTEFYISDQNEIVISLKEALDQQELMILKALIDSYDDAYWEYKDNEKTVKVILTYKGSKEVFFLNRELENQ